MAYSLLVFLLALAGGFSIMSIEMLGGRIMAPFFGSSIYVWGSIITVFMVALSIGYLLGGQLSLKNPSLRKFGALFLFCGVAVLPMIWVDQPLMNWVFMAVEDVRYGSLIAATGLFFLPTVAMGIISPYAVRLLVHSTHRSGSVAGKLYFVSTAGSAAGVLMTSFYFVLWFEMDTILLLLAGVLGACGVIALIGASIIGEQAAPPEAR
ncbi:MAG TPA: fused MFS/spermidine synthase [Gammaproteobacteria bacterium]|nr:fused MFS/spermidine synthase [Gammaproteobacteria bacterium]